MVALPIFFTIRAQKHTDRQRSKTECMRARFCVKTPDSAHQPFSCFMGGNGEATSAKRSSDHVVCEKVCLYRCATSEEREKSRYDGNSLNFVVRHASGERKTYVE